MKRSLNGLRILNTRPREQAAALSLGIQEADGVAIECPTLAIEGNNLSWLEHMPDLREVETALFISPNAVRYCFDAFKKQGITWPSQIHIIAIGPGTASTLTHFGLPITEVPEIADSEHVLSLSSLQTPGLKNVLLFKGEGGRAVLEEGLKQRGITVQALSVYRRTVPGHSQALLHALWQENVVDIILSTSVESLHNLFKLTVPAAHQWLQDRPYLVLSERIAQAASDLGIKRSIISQPKHILDSLLDYSEGLIHGY